MGEGEGQAGSPPPAPAPQAGAAQQPAGDDGGGRGSSGVQSQYEGAKRKSSEIVRRFLRSVNRNPTGVGFGLAAFAFVSLLCCVFNFGCKDASEQYAKEVGMISWPMSAHAACLILAVKGYYFQTSALKRKFLLLTLYSSSVAALSYFFLEKAAKYRLVTTDAFGQPFVFFRVLQWIHTTPAMLQSIASLADLNYREVTTLHALNQAMLITGLISHIVASYAVAVFFFVVCWVVFVFEMIRVHVVFLRIEDRATLLLNIREQSFKSALRDPRAPAVAHEIDQFRQSAETTLRMIRHLHWTTISLWTAFGLCDTLIVMGLLPVLAAEHAWALLDMLAKVLFSSMLSMTAVVSLDEAEKQSAWLNEQKAREEIRSSDEIMYEASSRTETLTKLCQEGWGLVVQTFMQKGIVPIVTLRRSEDDGAQPADDDVAVPNVDGGFGGPAGGLAGPGGFAPPPGPAPAPAAAGAKQRPVTGKDAAYGAAGADLAAGGGGGAG